LFVHSDVLLLVNIARLHTHTPTLFSTSGTCDLNVADCSRLHIMFTLAFQCCAPLCVVFVAYSRLHVMLTVCLRLRLRVESLGSCGSVKCRICSHSSGHPIDPLVGVSVSDIMFALAFVFENTRGAR
jgi:hypothetical protein